MIFQLAAFQQQLDGEDSIPTAIAFGCKMPKRVHFCRERRSVVLRQVLADCGLGVYFGDEALYSVCRLYTNDNFL